MALASRLDAREVKAAEIPGESQNPRAVRELTIRVKGACFSGDAEYSYTVVGPAMKVRAKVRLKRAGNPYVDGAEEQWVVTGATVYLPSGFEIELSDKESSASAGMIHRENNEDRWEGNRHLSFMQ